MTRLTFIAILFCVLTTELSFGQDIIIKNRNFSFENSNLNENQVKLYLENYADKLDLIEGIWSFSAITNVAGAISKQDNYGKFAIIKDTLNKYRDYVEILLYESNDLLDLTGQYLYCITGEYGKSAYSNFYLYNQYKCKTEIKNQPQTINFGIDEAGLLRGSVSFWTEGIKIEMNITGIRLYPSFTANKKSNKPIGATGSGFLINNEGYIATNYHVIKGAKKIQVINFDKTGFIAKTIISDS